MKKSVLRIAIFSLLAAAIALVPTQGLAQEKKKDDAAGEKEDAPREGKKKREGIPFRGKVDAVDKTAKTIKVGERTFHITAETRIRKAGKEATLDEGVVGEAVTGQYKKGDDDKLTALSVYFGPRPEGEGKGEKKKKTKDE